MPNYYWKTLILAFLLTIALTDCKADREDHQEDFEDDTEKKPENKVNSQWAIDEKGDELAYETPKYDMSKFYFVDSFDDVKKSQMKWIRSEAKKDDIADEIAKYDGKWEWEAPQRIIWKDDIGLVMKSKAKHAAISSLLRKPFTFNEEKPLVVQYEVTMQNGQECGGAYIKLLSANSKGNPSDYLKKFNDKTPYTIMFGPDKCGNDNKLHFIFRHVNPINGTIAEKHCRKPKDRLEELFKDKEPHLYHLLIKPNNQFEVRIDHKLINYGSLLEDFEPPVNPPREIDDPNDKKPENWDEREKIPDPTAKKPEDWDEDAPAQIPDTTAVIPDGWLLDEPEMIPDPTAIKPIDWDTEMDGDWEAPMIDNPVCEKAPGCGKWEPPMIANKEYKGKWYAPLIDNPNYKGKWKPRKIQNPDFFEDLTPFKMTPIGSVGIEIWSMSDDLLFDNLIITDDVKVAQDFAAQTYDLKRKFIEKQSQTLWHRLMLYINYKPGWWALYILYLLLPASAYIIYLSKRFKEATVTDKFTGIFKEYPLLWIIIIALTLLISFLFFKACTRKDVKNDTKKTDEPVPDADEATAAGGDSGGGGDSEVVDKVANASPKSKKTELDVSDDTLNDVQKMASDFADLETTDDSFDYLSKRDTKQKDLRQRHANTNIEEEQS